MFMQWLVSTLMTILIFMRRGVMWWGSFLLSSYAQIKQWKAWCDDLVQLADTMWRHWSWTSSLSQGVRRRNLKQIEKVHYYQVPNTVLPDWVTSIQNTVLRLQDFAVIHISSEINFGESRSSKSAVFAIYGALNLADWVNFSLQNVQ